MVRKRLLFGSIAVALVASFGIGYVVADHGSSADDSVTIDRDNPLDGGPLTPNAVVRGAPLPDVTVRTVDDAEVATMSLLGRPLVINVWNSECVPCKKELPDLAAAHREFGDRVRFVGIDPYYSSKAELDFAARYGVDYELLFDGDGRFTTATGITTQPVTLFVDADGTVVEQTGQLDLADLRRIIEADLL